MDEEGYQQPRRPRPKGVTFDELPITHRETIHRLRKTSKFAPLIDYDNDEYDMSYPPISSSSAYDASAASSSSSRDTSVSHSSYNVPSQHLANSGQPPFSHDTSVSYHSPALKELGPKKEEKRYAHDLKKVIEESEKIDRLQMTTRSDSVSPEDPTSSSSITGPMENPTPPHPDGSTRG